jgi:hypothetical protein
MWEIFSGAISGTFKSLREIISVWKIPEDERAKMSVQLAEMEQQAKLKALDLEFQDRKSAREREMAVKDWTPRVIAMFVLSVYAFIQWYVLTHIVAQEMREIVMRTLGTLDAIVGAIIYYYYGSSAGSAHKTQIIDKWVKDDAGTAQRVAKLEDANTVEAQR